MRPKAVGRARRIFQDKITALIGKLQVTVGLFELNINTDVFHGWAMQNLLSELLSHAVVVMDNTMLHKRQSIRDAIQNAGHTLEYLPVYSPDLNPDEYK